MGKRGPAPKGEYPDKSKVLSTRIRPDLRAQLDAASKESGRSLSQEIEHRLRRTFIEDEKFMYMFGSKTNFFIMRAIDLAIQTVVMNYEQKADWIHNPEIFEQVVKTIGFFLDAIRPPYVIRPPHSTSKKEKAIIYDPGDLVSRGTAALVWQAIQGADPSLPLQEGTNEDHRLALLKSELGAIAERPELSLDKAGNLRWSDEEMLVAWFRAYLDLLARSNNLADNPDLKEGLDVMTKIYKREWNLAVEAGPMPYASASSPRKRSRRKK